MILFFELGFNVVAKITEITQKSSHRSLDFMARAKARRKTVAGPAPGFLLVHQAFLFDVG
ncbi:hypothetical protein [Oceanibium sediminis]|uniref:hypothetical protein n=1 Tax=Oceanibium sediminis TaxID=2026339 RepID=UPI001E63FFB5|nr:hypothetical protein [Oceanibium sediminis]